MTDDRTPRNLLLEIGVEELPSSFVDGALAALPAIVAATLGELRIAHGPVRALGTPRRIAFIVEAVAGTQLDLDEEVVGPPEAAAFKDGAPTRAAEAFAAKLGIDVRALAIVDRPAGPKQKAGRYVVGRRVEAGKPSRELLGKALADVCAAIPFRKSMRWGEADVTFGRPVQWLVALYGEHLVDVGFAGVRSTAKSRGHRFLSPDLFVVKSADTYVDQLRHHHVLVDRHERAKVMMDKVAAAARALGGVHDPSPSLVDENASLVEEPHVVVGAFDEGFLSLPAAVIRAVARGHQKYFCVQTSDDALLPRYLTVANTANDPAKVAKGNDRVMRARLADARFFFEEDKKAKLEDRVAKLEGIVFHHRLGTVRAKVRRIERLARLLGTILGLPPDELRLAARAAHLAKADLVSLMVGELPELQGHMGRAYALNAGEGEDVADAIRDHYRPVGAADSVAEGDLAAIVALADRFDTLTGCFAIGVTPTGAADPFALRRACIGMLRTLLDKGAVDARYGRVVPSEIVGAAYDGYDGVKLDASREDTVGRVELFMAERLRGLLASATTPAVADAVMASHNQVGGTVYSATQFPAYSLMKARALEQAVAEEQPWLAQARTVAKRLGGISRDAAPVLHPKSAFSKDDDAAIVDLVAHADTSTRELAGEDEVRQALAKMGELAQSIDAIFLRTLVNDPEDPLTPKRLELLSFGAQCMLRIADFSRLV